MQRGWCNTTELAHTLSKLCTGTCACDGNLHIGACLALSRVCTGTHQLAMIASALVRGRAVVPAVSIPSKCVQSPWQHCLLLSGEQHQRKRGWSRNLVWAGWHARVVLASWTEPQPVFNLL